MQLFPNPATDQLELRLDATLGAGDIAITDGLGRMVRTERVTGDRVRLDVKDMLAGIYMITFHGERGVAAVRFVKQ